MDKTNYQGNSKKGKEGEDSDKTKKKLTKVIEGEAVAQKKSLGRKFKELIIEADFRSVTRYIFMDVLIPAAKNMIVEAATQGIERTVYGESKGRRPMFGQPTRVTYNSPVGRTPRDSERNRYGPGTAVVPRASRRGIQSFALPTREDAQRVLDSMNDVIDQYEEVSVDDLNSLLGIESSYVDQRWGWTSLLDAEIRQVREGFILDLPQPEPTN